MSGLKEGDISFVQAGRRVSPDEIDQYTQYVVENPSVSTTFFGTVTSATPAAFVMTQTYADYPRNVLLAIAGVAGGMGGTAVINGLDFHGNVIQESIGFGTAASGGTQAGTLVFAQVTSGTVTPVGLGGTALGTARLGVAIGTAAGLVAKFGLPDILGAVTDIKSLNYINNGTVNVIGTPSTQGTIGPSAFLPTAIVAITDRYNVLYRTTRDNAGRGYQAKL